MFTFASKKEIRNTNNDDINLIKMFKSMKLTPKVYALATLVMVRNISTVVFCTRRCKEHNSGRNKLNAWLYSFCGYNVMCYK